jgi:hypothetical protein
LYVEINIKGQGDILAGLMALYLHWNNKTQNPIHIPLIFASIVTRQAMFRAFEKNKLGFMVSQSLGEITSFANFLLDLRDKKITEDFEFLV